LSKNPAAAEGGNNHAHVPHSDRGLGTVLIEVLCALASTRRLVAFAWPVPGLRLIHAP